MDLRERARWAEARRVVVDRVASLADWNPGLCREAALVAAEWEPEVASLLLDAADHGGQGERSADGDLRS